MPKSTHTGIFTSTFSTLLWQRRQQQQQQKHVILREDHSALSADHRITGTLRCNYTHRIPKSALKIVNRIAFEFEVRVRDYLNGLVCTFLGMDRRCIWFRKRNHAHFNAEDEDRAGQTNEVAVVTDVNHKESVCFPRTSFIHANSVKAPVSVQLVHALGHVVMGNQSTTG